MKRGFAMAFLFLLVILSSNTVLADIVPCDVFPSDSIWNREIYNDPVHPQSTVFINNILNTGGDFVHPDFGENPDYGIPWVLVDDSDPTVNITFDYDDESDVGPYPFYPGIPIEGNGNECGDCHVIAINTDTCMLYETWYTQFDGANWTAGSGAIFDLGSNALRPAGWTSADAAGLPIFPGLARCDEIADGVINHALRFTINRPYNGFYVYPARHVSGSNTNASFPVYGARMRLKADYDLSEFSGQALIIATAMKRYGLILADIGSNWYISGESTASPSPDCWNDDILNQLKDIHGSAFEFVAYPATTAATPRTNHFTTGNPSLSWTPITWATEYEIQVDDSSNLASPIRTINAGLANSFAVTPALPDGRYYWRVRAKRADGTWGSYSVIETFTVDA